MQMQTMLRLSDLGQTDELLRQLLEKVGFGYTDKLLLIEDETEICCAEYVLLVAEDCEELFALFKRGQPIAGMYMMNTQCGRFGGAYILEGDKSFYSQDDRPWRPGESMASETAREFLLED